MELQDEYTYVIQKIGDPEYVVDLDISSFRALHDSCLRLDAAEKVEQSEIAHFAAQAETKELRKMMAYYSDRAMSNKTKAKKSGADFLASKWGKGIK